MTDGMESNRRYDADVVIVGAGIADSPTTMLGAWNSGRKAAEMVYSDL